MLIPFITEPDYGRASIWCADTRVGIEAEIARKKYTAVNIDGESLRFFDFDTLFSKTDSRRMVVLIGTSRSWIPEALDYLMGLDIDVLLVSYQPPENAPVRGVVRIDYVSGTDTLLRHLSDCGCRRPALYGCFRNSSADSIKRRAFDEITSRPGIFDCARVFENNAGLVRCYEEFRPYAGEFDCVLCVNDIAAASLINRLSADHIKVPDDIQVACFGSSEIISRLYHPTVTSLPLNHTELGRQSVSAFSYLAKSERNVSISVRVGGSLTQRESTRPDIIGSNSELWKTARHPDTSFYDDDEVRAFSTLENILTCCDKTDISILENILVDETTECIAEKLSLAPETVRYRIRRILQTVGMKTRAELVGYIRGNNFGGIICK